MLNWLGLPIKVAEWIARYVLRERRVIKAYTLTYPLLDINPVWQPHLTVLYQGQPITGFHFYSIRYRNDGSRSVAEFPVNVTVSPGAVIVWPSATPVGCLKEVSFPAQNQLSAQLDFINPKEEVNLCFWSFNDPGNTLIVTGRCPDVGFSVRPWQPRLDRATTVAIKSHYVVFWLGFAVLLAGISYGLYKLGALAFRAVKLHLLA